MVSGFNKWSIFPIATFFMGIILFISLMTANWRFVGALEYGIVYNTASVQLDNATLYGPGRHSIGPGSVFLTFPSTDETILFNDASTNATQAFPLGNSFVQPFLTARTKDGLKITMDALVNYKIGRSDDPSI